MQSPAGPPDWEYRLGKAPAEPGAIKFAFFSYFAPPELRAKPPEHFRHADPPPWGVWAGKKYGTCVWDGAANETMLWEHEGGLDVPVFSETTILSEYQRVAGWVPNNPKTDRGTSMAKAAAHRRKVGISDVTGKLHKVDAYTFVTLNNMDYLKFAMWTLGGVGLGFKFPQYAMQQFKDRRPWDMERGPVEGGHYVPAIGIAPNGNIITVSWGREQEMTPDFYMTYADEVIGWLDLDRLSKSSRISPEGFNESRLRHDLTAVAQGRVYALGDWPDSSSFA